MRLHSCVFPPMNLRELMEGCDLDAVQTAALERLVALKRDLPEGGTIRAVDPALGALVAAEEAAAGRFVEGAPQAQPDPALRAEADRIHREITLAADPGVTGRVSPPDIVSNP